MRRAVVLALVALAGLVAWPARDAAGGEVRGTVVDQRGRPVPDAVLLVSAAGALVLGAPKLEVVDQIGQEFVPYVKPIVVGSSVSFPNRDNVRHHVYSFSPAKRFELPLYIGTPAQPVLFDQPGGVTLGCNIHDWMVGHIYVSDTPFVGQTAAAGTAVLGGLASGRYGVRVWHPRMQESEASTRRSITLEPDGTVHLEWRLTIRRDLRAPRPGAPGAGGYR
jgi:plastocyanin